MSGVGTMGGGPGRYGRWRLRLAGAVGAVFAFRYACFAAMTAMALWAEARPAPHLPDLVLAHVPYMEEVRDWNYVVWLLSYVPVALTLLWLAPRRFCRYMVTSGILSLVRGACIMVTGLGPVTGADVNPTRLAAPGTVTRAFWEILDPTGVFFRDSANIYLTKDLFFSGHTGTTLLLLLYVWPYPRLRRWMLAGHLVVVASVFLSHLHYTIDVVGAYAIGFSLFVLREGDPKAGLRRADGARGLW